jgi:hypothetical protein
MVNDRYAQGCMDSPWNGFESFNFANGAVNRFAADSRRFALCGTEEAARERQKEGSATRESDASS